MFSQSLATWSDISMPAVEAGRMVIPKIRKNGVRAPLGKLVIPPVIYGISSFIKRDLILGYSHNMDYKDL